MSDHHYSSTFLSEQSPSAAAHDAQHQPAASAAPHPHPHPHHDSRFNCNICLEPVSEPVVTRCGHLYCWPCLYRWLEPGMTTAERYDMGWYGGAGINNNSTNSRGRRCCPVCKAECTVRAVVPIYVRESDQDVDASDVYVDVDEASPSSPSGAAAAAAAAADSTADDIHSSTGLHDAMTASTGLRRRRAAGAGGTNNTSNHARLHVSTNYNDDNASLSTISTEGDHNNSNNSHHRASSETTIRTSPAHPSEDAIPSRPTPEPYLHQRSSQELETTPRSNNQHSHQRGQGPPPPSPPRAARPSSLSNGLSLSFWSGVVDALLVSGNNSNSPSQRQGRAGAGNGQVPPIHRPGSWRGRHRAVVEGRGGGANGNGRDSRGGQAHSSGGSVNGGEAGSDDASSAGMGSSAVAVPHFPPAPIEDATTEFLSRLLLMLGSFVIFCLLLF